MATGVSGYFDLSESVIGITARVYYEETYDEDAGTSVITITNLQFSSSVYYGYSYVLDGYIKVDGNAVVNMSGVQGSHTVLPTPKNTFVSVKSWNGFTNYPWSSNPISHNADGSKSVTIELSISSSNQDNKDWVITGSKTIQLTSIDNGLVYIDNGTTFEAYQCFIDNGTSWDKCIPYIDNGSGWDVCK